MHCLQDNWLLVTIAICHSDPQKVYFVGRGIT